MVSNSNPYLTVKAVTKKRMATLTVVICAFFGAVFVYSAIELFMSGEIGSGIISCILFAAIMMPVYRILSDAYRKISARRIAEALVPLSEGSLTFEQLQTALSSEKALQQIKTLIGKGYLQNLKIDMEERTVALYVPAGAYVHWICPNCGAKNSERKGGVLRCKYCDQPFTK